jgi:antitoxin component YwqK of YwqJK toxin-antitoxin module
MKRILIVLLLVGPVLMYAQDQRDVTVLKDQNLVEVVYYHDNGIVHQKGTYNLQGELHGKWESFTTEGKKLSIGSFYKGKKHGKWFFWDNEILREVDYDQNQIASVHEWKEGAKLAFQR